MKRRASVRFSPRLAKRQRLMCPIIDMCKDIIVEGVARYLDPASRVFLA